MAEQITLEELRQMSPEHIVKARAEGKLDALLAGTEVEAEFTAPEDAPRGGENFPSYRHYLRALTPQQIVDARRAGRLPSKG